MLESAGGLTYPMGVLFFKQLMDFKESALARLRDKRRARRYAVGLEFPLKGTVNLIGSDNAGRAKASAAGSGRDWAGRLMNLSSLGASLQLPPAALTVRGEKTILTVSVEEHVLEIPAVVAHFRVYSSHAVCGLSLQFADLRAQKPYLQLVEAVAVGGSFLPVKASRCRRNSPTHLVEQYVADNKARLTVWREGPVARVIDSFELVMGDHCIRGQAKDELIEVYSRKKGSQSARTALSAPSYALSTGENEEPRQLFRWVVPNLPKAVPGDLRGFLQRYVR